MSWLVVSNNDRYDLTAVNSLSRSLDNIAIWVCFFTSKNKQWGFLYNMEISCFRLAKNVNSCYVLIQWSAKTKKDDNVQICHVKVFLTKMLIVSRSLRNVCWTIFVYNTPIIFARRKQLCACAHKLRKGPIYHTRTNLKSNLCTAVRQAWETSSRADMFCLGLSHLWGG